MGTNREEVQKLKKDAGLKPYQLRLKDLQEVNGEYRAYCPWHEADGKHTPSLAIYKSKDDGLWNFKCMSGAECAKHSGDVIAFVMQTDGLTFPEAMRKIANDIGIAQPESAAAEDAHLQGTVAGTVGAGSPVFARQRSVVENCQVAQDGSSHAPKVGTGHCDAV